MGWVLRGRISRARIRSAEKFPILTCEAYTRLACSALLLAFSSL